MPTTITSTGVTTTTVDATNLKNLTVPTASGTVVGSGANYPSNIDASATANSIQVDSSGRSFRGNIPYIQLLHDSTTTYAANATITQWRTYSSNGITHTPLGVLNVPVAGLYQVGISMIHQGNSGIYLKINDVVQFRLGYGNQATGETWSNPSGNAIIPLAANDNVRLMSENNVSYYGDSGTFTVSSFYLYLIG